MKLKKFSLITLISVISLTGFSEVAKAECASYTRRDSGPALTLHTYKYQVGTTAFSTLWNIGYQQAGMIIGASHNYFGNCSFPGVGVGTASGSGNMQDGVYPNDASVTFWIYGGDVDINVARSAIYSAISASPDPAPTTTTTTTTTQVPQQDSAPQTTSSTATSVVTNTTIPVTMVEEDDGQILEDYAELIINKSGTRYVIEIDSSFPSQNMLVRARIGSRRSVVWNVITNVNGYRRIITNRNIAGYSISLWMNGERYDLVTVQ